MRTTWLLFLIFLTSQMACMAQHDPPDNLPSVSDEAFDRELKHLLRFSAPVIGVEEVRTLLGKALILDARESEEYETSHIPGARYVGYEQFKADALRELPRDTTIVVYCSVGYRSERIAERLQAEGFRKVYNLYGGIFEWANRGLPLESNNGAPAHSVHTYNKRWSKWVRNPKVKKVW